MFMACVIDLSSLSFDQHIEHECRINKFIDLIALHNSHLSIGSIAYSNDPIKENRTI